MLVTVWKLISLTRHTECDRSPGRCNGLAVRTPFTDAET
jgi:hypothetical protein